MTAILLVFSNTNLYAQHNDNKKKVADTINRNASNRTFLLDVSNSMGQDNKMLLLKKSTEELLKLLNKKDQDQPDYSRKYR